MSDFTDVESHIIGMMMRAEKTLPDDMWAVAAVQELACLLAKLRAVLTDEQFAMLVGIGAYISRAGKAEMMAEIHAKMALAKASRP